MTTYCEAEDCAYNWEGKCAAAGDVYLDVDGCCMTYSQKDEEEEDEG